MDQDEAAAIAAAAEMTDDDEDTLPKLSCDEHFARGKELYAEKDYDGAAQHFARALQYKVDEFDQLAWQTGPYYFEYGRALLNDYTSKTGIFGDRKGEEAAGDQDEGDEEELEAEAAEAAEAAEGDDEATAASSSSSSSAAAAADAGAAGDAEEQAAAGEGEDAEDSVAQLEDLQIVYELLAVARVIYERIVGVEPTAAASDEAAAVRPDWFGQYKELGHEDAPAVLREIYIRLGDVAMEQEDFQQAYEEFLNAQNIAAEFFPEDYVKLGDIHDELAVASLYQGKSVDGLAHYEASLSCFGRNLLQEFIKLRPADALAKEAEELFGTEPEPKEEDEGDEQEDEEAEEKDDEYDEFEEKMIQLALKTTAAWLKEHAEIDMKQEEEAQAAAAKPAAAVSSSSSSSSAAQAAKPKLSAEEFSFHKRANIVDGLRERIEDLKQSIKEASEFAQANGEGDADTEGFSESALASMLPNIKNMLQNSVQEILSGLKAGSSDGFDESVFGNAGDDGEKFEFGGIKQGDSGSAGGDDNGDDDDDEIPGILPSEESAQQPTPKLQVRRKKRAHGDKDEAEEQDEDEAKDAKKQKQ